MTRGALATLQGELGQAVADLELSTPMAQEHGEGLACALGHAYRCLALTFSGRYAEAAAAGTVAGERLGAIDHFSGLVALDICLGYLHLLSGELDLAIERCERGLRRLGDSRERWARGYLQIVTARALFFQGKYTESAVATCGSLEMKHELGDVVGRPTAWRRWPCWRCGRSDASARRGFWGRRVPCGTGLAGGSAARPSSRNSTSRR